MRGYKRSMIRLLLFTAFLLFGAWLALKTMQYKGDVAAISRDLEKLGIVRFAREKVLPVFSDTIIPFFRDKLGPAIEGAAKSIRDAAGSIFG